MFLTKLQETRNELAVVGSTPQGSELVRLALNSVSEEWHVFVQSILGRVTLPNWDEMWAALKQEELRRDLVECKLDRSSNSGSKPKEEEENAALTSKWQQEQWRQKKDVSRLNASGVVKWVTTQHSVLSGRRTKMRSTIRRLHPQRSRRRSSS